MQLEVNKRGGCGKRGWGKDKRWGLGEVGNTAINKSKQARRQPLNIDRLKRGFKDGRGVRKPVSKNLK